MKSLLSSWMRFLHSDEGAVTIEFVIAFPLVMTIFMSSFESSFYMARHVMLERAVDLVIRDLRLGMLVGVTHTDLKKEICARSILLAGSPAECQKGLKIWLQPVNTATFAMPITPTSCVDRSAPIDPMQAVPATEFALGAGNQIMLVRVCMKQDPMFLTTPIGAGLVMDDDGGYSLVTASVFVNEPG
ncbi:pilus assembly protein [Tabrizicola sp.]|uniref:TadE/TadG family type IV pilus assembly protein n=1 Tax=Tabrizicola sp. TaxID=2005166 RepID=UPI00286A0F38|nr:pilus assembly protein [Tabrizicola sp.]